MTSPSGHSYLAVEGGVILASAPEVETLSTIGSGDAYLAGMLAGLLHRKLSPIEAVRLAAGCAAANAETLGAGVFERDGLELPKSPGGVPTLYSDQHGVQLSARRIIRQSPCVRTPKGVRRPNELTSARLSLQAVRNRVGEAVGAC